MATRPAALTGTRQATPEYAFAWPNLFRIRIYPDSIRIWCRFETVRWEFTSLLRLLVILIEAVHRIFAVRHLADSRGLGGRTFLRHHSLIPESK